MSPALSSYLELVRVVATLIVFVSHSSAMYGPFAEIAWLDRLGRDGVVIFFVLSGYVISWCAAERDRHLVDYAVNRASRIYSVAVPGLLLALAVTWLAHGLQPAAALDYRLQKLWAYVPIYLGFAGNFWYLNETPPNNFPYWSLYCEVWYYVMFAVWFYGRGAWRWLALAGLALLIGPWMLQLGLMWLAGSALYFQRHRLRWSPATARGIAFGSVAAYVLTKTLGVDDWLDGYIKPVWMALTGSTEHAPEQRFGDYWIAMLVVLNIHAVQQGAWRLSERIGGPVRTVASYSFSAYLFHIPLYAALRMVLPDRQSPLQFVVAVALCIVGIAGLARVTEHRKAAWRHAFSRLADRVVRARPARLGA